MSFYEGGECMSKNSNSGLKIEWLYALLGITVFIMGVFYAASLKNELGFWHNFLITHAFHFVLRYFLYGNMFSCCSPMNTDHQLGYFRSLSLLLYFFGRL